MKIRSYFSIFLISCLLGSYLSIYVLVEQYSREREANQRYVESKLATKDIERLTSHFKQLIVTTDLILASGITYLALSATKNANLLAREIDSMKSFHLYQASGSELDTLMTNLLVMQQSVNTASALNLGSDNLHITRLMNTSDNAASLVIAALGQLRKQQETIEENYLVESKSKTHKSRLVTAVIVSAFSLWIVAIWFWVRRHIGNPVKQLSERAEHAIDHSGIFKDLKRGPIEVIQLSKKLSLLISGLEEEVLHRTKELKDSKSQLQQSNNRLKEEIRQHLLSDERFESSFNNAAIGMAIVNLDGRIIKTNPNFQEFFGCQEADLSDTRYTDLLFEQERDIFEERYTQLINKKLSTIQLQQQYCDMDGSGQWGQLSVSLVTDDLDSASYAIFQLQNITESYELSERLSYQANHDPLTKLYNRYEFEVRLKGLIVDADKNPSKTNHVVCYMDLDQFKIVNDTCGHLAGDELLKNVADCISLNLRDSDIVARLGGDEFGLLLKNCPRNRALEIANKIREEIHEIRFQYEGKVFRIGASIGMTIIEGSGINIKDIMSAADTACYMAKESGRNCIQVFDLKNEILAARTKEMTVASNINIALEENRFFLVRQIIVPLNDHLANTESNHYEVLVRMLDDNNNVISPGLFLPAAERYHLASRIDRWVVETALNHLSNSVSSENAREIYAINLSGQSLANEDLLNDIVDIVKSSNLDNIEVCFEITETAAISNLNNARKYIDKLKALGCTFALDDFGKGLSSFGYLKTLSVDYLKIDGEFVRDLLLDDVDLAMVKSINEVAHAAGKLTIAEYVENGAIAEALIDMGVDYAQGYHYGKPEEWICFSDNQTITKLAM